MAWICKPVCACPFGTPENPSTLRGVVETAYRQPGVFWDYLRSEETPLEPLADADPDRVHVHLRA